MNLWKYFAITHFALVILNLVMAVLGLQAGNMFALYYLVAAFMWGILAYFNWNTKS